MVLAEMFREYRQKKQEQRVREGRAQGIAEGRAEAHTLWKAWLARLEEAKKNNLPFTEPPPSLEDALNESSA